MMFDNLLDEYKVGRECSVAYLQKVKTQSASALKGEATFPSGQM